MKCTALQRAARRRRFDGLDGLEPRKLLTAVTVDPSVQADAIAEVSAIRSELAGSVATNQAAAALDAALATLDNDLSQSSGTVSNDTLATDSAAADTALANSITLNPTGGKGSVGGGGSVGGSTPIGGIGPNTGTPIPPFDPTNPIGSIGARLKWRRDNWEWSGGIWIQSPDYPYVPN